MAYLSFTADAKWRRCRRQYLIEAILKLSTYEEKPAVWFGSMFHKCLEVYYKIMRDTCLVPPAYMCEFIAHGMSKATDEVRAWIEIYGNYSDVQSAMEAWGFPRRIIKVVSINQVRGPRILCIDNKWYVSGIRNYNTYWKEADAMHAAAKHSNGGADLSPEDTVNTLTVSEDFIGVFAAFMAEKGEKIDSGDVLDERGQKYSVKRFENMTDLVSNRLHAYSGMYGSRDLMAWEILEVEGGGEMELQDSNGRVNRFSKWNWRVDMKVRDRLTGDIIIVEFKTCKDKNLRDDTYREQKIGYCALESAKYSEPIRKVIARYTRKKSPEIPEVVKCRIAGHKKSTEACTHCGAGPGEDAKFAVSGAAIDTTAAMYIDAVAALGLSHYDDEKYDEMVHTLRENWYFKEIESTVTDTDVDEFFAGAWQSNIEVDQGWSIAKGYRSRLLQDDVSDLSNVEKLAMAPLEVRGYFRRNGASCGDFGGCVHKETCWGSKPEVDPVEAMMSEFSA